MGKENVILTPSGKLSIKENEIYRNTGGPGKYNTKRQLELGRPTTTCSASL